MTDAERLADEIASKLRSVPGQGTAVLRAIGREYSRALRGAKAGFVVEVGERLAAGPGGCRFVAYEILVRHKGAFLSLTPERIVKLGEGLSSWSAVDCFGVILAGPAWREGLLSGEVVRGWAVSEDRWWRRAALVSTIALSRSGRAAETIGICALLAADRDDMVVKALSWALRELAKRHPEEVWRFLGESWAVRTGGDKRPQESGRGTPGGVRHEGLGQPGLRELSTGELSTGRHGAVLAARVRREVRNKLISGLARPRKSARLFPPG